MLDSNADKPQSSSRGICLFSQLSGRAKDTCRVLTNDQLRSADAPAIKFDLLYQSDDMSAVSDVLYDL